MCSLFEDYMHISRDTIECINICEPALINYWLQTLILSISILKTPIFSLISLSLVLITSFSCGENVWVLSINDQYRIEYLHFDVRLYKMYGLAICFHYRVGVGGGTCSIHYMHRRFRKKLHSVLLKFYHKYMFVICISQNMIPIFVRWRGFSVCVVRDGIDTKMCPGKYHIMWYLKICYVSIIVIYIYIYIYIFSLWDKYFS